MGLNSRRPGLSIRIVAASAIDAVLNRGRNADEAVAEGSRKFGLDDRDHAFAVLIVLTTLRRMGEIDIALAKYLAKPLPRKSGLAIQVLRTAVAQVWFLETPPYAAISLAVDAARADRDGRHFVGLINAVLRKTLKSPPEAAEALVAGETNTPRWLWDRWVRQYGVELARHIAAAHLQEPQTDVVVKEDVNEWVGRLGGEVLVGHHIRLPRGAPPIPDLPGFEAGAWWVQDVAAGFPVMLLGDVTGKQVADLCAAPGGKTMQLCSVGAEVTAVDSSKARLQRLHENLRRTGYKAEVICADVLKLEQHHRFDAVLLDAPCSATGTIRRHPEITHVRTERDIEQLIELQGLLLDKAADLVRPGGRLVYCTCSLESEEGEDQVRRFLLRHSGFSICEEAIGKAGLPMAYQTAPGMARTLPHFHIGKSVGMDGFFAAAMRRGT